MIELFYSSLWTSLVRGPGIVVHTGKRTDCSVFSRMQLWDLCKALSFWNQIPQQCQVIQMEFLSSLEGEP